MRYAGLMIMLLIVVMSGCGGGSAAAVHATVNWPQAYDGLDKNVVTLSGSLMGLSEDGSYTDIVSGPALSKSENDKYLIEFDGAGDGPYLLVAEIVVDEISVGKANALIVIAGGETEVEVKESDFIDIGGGDDDGDGASNLLEVMWGTNPSVSDMPDMDSDGVSDFLDDDIDGDGLGNEEEIALGSDPMNRDSDNDQLRDDLDNCPITSNNDQKDSDHDGLGDVCSADNDGDGLTDEVEAVKGTNPDLFDTDGDGRSDSVDLFPLDSLNWSDADGDGVGDATDNCPTVANPDQKNMDMTCYKKGYQVEADENGDLCDTDPEGDYEKYVFVDSRNGNDLSECAGLKNLPFRSLKKAYDAAVQRGESVKAAIGEYDVSSVSLNDGVDLKGGYGPDFNEAGRRFYSDNELELSVLYSSKAGPVLDLSDIQDEFLIEGFYFRSNQSDAFTDTVSISRSNIVLKHNYIAGSRLSPNTRAFVADSGSNVVLDANRIDGRATATGVSSVAISIDGAGVVLTNNIILGGAARHTTGIEVKNASPLISNNTVDAGSNSSVPQVSRGIVVINAAPSMANNLIFTDQSSDQTLIWCQEGSLNGAVFQNNMFATFPQSSPHSYWVDCYGKSSRDPNYPVAGALVDGNVHFSGGLDSMITGDYHLKGLGLNQGINTNSPEYGGVVSDYYDNPRALNHYDIGAVEN